VQEGLRKPVRKPLTCPSLTIQYNKNNPLISYTGKPLSVSLRSYKRVRKRQGRPSKEQAEDV